MDRDTAVTHVECFCVGLVHSSSIRSFTSDFRSESESRTTVTLGTAVDREPTGVLGESVMGRGAKVYANFVNRRHADYMGRLLTTEQTV